MAVGFHYGAVRIGFALSLAAALGCHPAEPPPHVDRTPLTRVAVGYQPGGLAIADDGRRWSYRVQTSADVTLHASDAPPLRLAAAFPPRFGPRGALLYSWIFERGSLHPTLLIGGRQIPTDFARQGHVSFSPDGTRWAVVGAPGPATPPPGPEAPLAVLVDGVLAGTYADVSLPTFSPDGRHVAWLAEESADTLALVVDGTVRRRFIAPGGGATPRRRRTGITPMLPRQCVLQYLPDGRLLWLAPHGRGWTVGRDEQVLAAYAGNVGADESRDDTGPNPFATDATILPAGVTTARTAPVAVWWERMAGTEPRWRVVRDGEPVDGLVCVDWWPQPPVVSDDGVRVGYPCRTREGATRADVLPVHVIAAGRRYGPYGDVWGLALAPAGEGAAWAAQSLDARGGWRFQHDGQPIGPAVSRPLATALDAGGHVGWAGWQDAMVAIGVDDTTIARGHEVVFGPEATGPASFAWVVRRRQRVVRFDARFDQPRGGSGVARGRPHSRPDLTAWADSSPAPAPSPAP